MSGQSADNEPIFSGLFSKIPPAPPPVVAVAVAATEINCLPRSLHHLSSEGRERPELSLVTGEVIWRENVRV